MRNHILRIASCVFLLLTAARSTGAQPSRIQLSGGYQITHAPQQTLPAGWLSGVAVRLDSAWSAVGEIDRAWKSIADQGLGTHVNVSLQTYGAGIRWTPRAHWRTAPYLHVLAGGERERANTQIASTTIGGSRTNWMLQPGAGVDIPLGGRLSAAVQVDVRHVFLTTADGEDENRLRLFVGVRLGM